MSEGQRQSQESSRHWMLSGFSTINQRPSVKGKTSRYLVALSGKGKDGPKRADLAAGRDFCGRNAMSSQRARIQNE